MGAMPGPFLVHRIINPGRHRAKQSERSQDAIGPRPGDALSSQHGIEECHFI
jgi:hypothetical protein